MYLVDGDGGGDDCRQRLIDADVDVDRIIQLPEGWALEDLLEPDYVLAKMADPRRSATLPLLSLPHICPTSFARRRRNCT